jgi:hypothetical protein
MRLAIEATDPILRGKSRGMVARNDSAGHQNQYFGDTAKSSDRSGNALAIFARKHYKAGKAGLAQR